MDRLPTWLTGARPLLRRVADILLRLLAVFLAASLCSFVTIAQPVLRVVFDSVSGFVDFFVRLASNWADLSDLVLYSYALSMLAVLTAIGLSIVFGVLAGFVTGIRPDSPISRIVRGLSYAGTMTPSFLLALFIMIFFVLYVLPATGIRFILLSRDATVFDPRRLVPVAMVLCVRPLAYFTSLVSTITTDTLYADYIRTARSKGLTERQIVLYHVWPNVLPAVLDGIPVALLYCIGSLLIVEFVFNWPGMGLQLLIAVVARPRPGVSSANLVSFLLAAVGMTYVLSVLIVDAVRPRVDPRVRQRATR